MTVLAEVPVTTHTGDGVTTAFLIGFTVRAGSVLLVSVNADLLSVTVDYDVVGDQVVFVDPPADQAAIAFLRRTEIAQQKAFPSQPTMVPKAVEGALNTLTLIAQELDARLDRVALAPPGEVPVPPGGVADPALVAEEVGKQIGGALDGKANANGSNLTINVMGWDRPASAILSNMIYSPADLGIWDPTPGAYNDAAVNELLGNTRQSRVDRPIRMAAGLVIPKNHLVAAPDNADISLDRTEAFAAGSTPLIFDDSVTMALDFALGARAHGLTLLKACATGTFTSIKQVLDAVAAYSGVAFHANSVPGVELKDITAVGFGLGARINGCERFVVAGMKLDCEAGWDITDIFDASQLLLPSRYPYLAQAFLRWYVSPANPAFAGLDAGAQERRKWEVACCNVRSGPGLKISPLAGLGTGTGADGVQVGDFLCYGAIKAFWGQDINACQLNKLWLDNAIIAIPTPAEIAAWEGLSPSEKAFAQSWYSRTPEEQAANAGLDPYLYKWHPLYGHYQPMGLALEGNCQNTTASQVHVDSHDVNYGLLHAAGTVPPIVVGTTGQARSIQILQGANEPHFDIQYAGVVDDAVVAVMAGVEPGAVALRGRNSTAPNRIRFADTADAAKVAVDMSRWVHNGEFRAPLIDARPTGNPALTAGTYPCVFADVREDRGGHLTGGGAAFTAQDHGWVLAEVHIPFRPVAATSAEHEVVLLQNGNPYEANAVTAAATTRAHVAIKTRVFVHAGDTLSFSITHGGAATWVGAEAYCRFTGVN